MSGDAATNAAIGRIAFGTRRPSPPSDFASCSTTTHRTPADPPARTNPNDLFFLDQLVRPRDLRLPVRRRRHGLHDGTVAQPGDDLRIYRRDGRRRGSRVTPLLTTYLKMPTPQTWIVIVAIFVAAGAVLSALLRLALNEMVGPNISVPDRVAGAALGALRVALLAIMLVVIFDRAIPPGQEPAFLKGSQAVLGRAARPAASAARDRDLYRPPEAPPPPVTPMAVCVAARPSCPVPLNLFVSWHDPFPDQRVYFTAGGKGVRCRPKDYRKEPRRGSKRFRNAARAAGLTGSPS